MTINDPSSKEGPFILKNYQELSDAIRFSDNSGNETGLFYLTEAFALNRLNLPTTASQAQEAILGTWDFPCSVDIDISAKWTITYDSDGYATQRTYFYNDTQCTDFSHSFVGNERYTIGEKTLDSSGRIAFEINYNADGTPAYGLVAFKVNGLYNSIRMYSADATPENRSKDIDRTYFSPKL